MSMLQTLWSSCELTVNIKIDRPMVMLCVFFYLLYAAETWTIREYDSRKLLAFKMRCYRILVSVLEGQSQQVSVREKTESSRLDNAKEDETIRSHLQDERQTISD